MDWDKSSNKGKLKYCTGSKLGILENSTIGRVANWEYRITKHFEWEVSRNTGVNLLDWEVIGNTG